MGTAYTAAAGSPSSDRVLRRSGWLLLVLGLLGHLYAAYATGGSWTAYWHHVLGFVVILIVTGGVIAGVGYRYWRSRRAPALFVIAAVQALIGLRVALA